MIEALRGKLITIDEGSVLLEVGGLALRIAVPLGLGVALERQLVGAEVRLACHFLVRPDAWKLFGFEDDAQRDLFRILLGIPGIGPRLALSILSHLSWEEIQGAVAAQNQARFEAVPGIGKRSAARIVVELAGKIEQRPNLAAPASGTPTADAVDALTALGLARAEAARLVRRAAEELGSGSDSAELIATALRQRGAIS